MQKELEQTLSQITMYSKMGRYISNKILKYNKKSKKNSQKPVYTNPPPVEEYLRIKKPIENKSAKISTHRQSSKMYMTHPPVGYYKVNHSQIQRNSQYYNFDRSVPHFYRQKFHCNQSQPVLKNYPDVTCSKPYVKGLIELQRITGRENIKGSIRKTIEDPHQKRFQMIEDHKSIDQSQKSRINFTKFTSRDSFGLFKSNQFAPQYDAGKDCNPKRLDTHLIPFQRMSPRNENHMILKHGISDCFNQAQTKLQDKAQDWKKILPREKTGLLPSYMDKNINTRSSITLLNLKTLEMNSTDMRKLPPKLTKNTKKAMRFIQQDQTDKQNFLKID